VRGRWSSRGLPRQGVALATAMKRSVPGFVLVLAAVALVGAGCGGARPAQNLTRATTQRINRIAFRTARRFGDAHPRALAITSPNSGGPIRVILHGRFVCQKCSASSHTGTAGIRTITLTLDRSTLRVLRSWFAGTGRGHGSFISG
jgi:hypothetical protein